MADDLISGYAKALLTLAETEGDPTQFANELSQIAQAIGASEELRTTLANQEIPAGRRQQIAEELFGGKVSRVTTAAVSMVIGAGRGGELDRIASRRDRARRRTTRPRVGRGPFRRAARRRPAGAAHPGAPDQDRQGTRG